jgi:hypothetical protein
MRFTFGFLGTVRFSVERSSHNVGPQVIVEGRFKHSALAQSERFGGQGRMPSASFDL